MRKENISEVYSGLAIANSAKALHEKMIAQRSAIPELPKIDYSEIIRRIEDSNLASINPINPEDTIWGDIKKQIESQNTLVTQQIDILVAQNKLLEDNYDKLKSLYDQQVDAYVQAQTDLQTSKEYNRRMMIISIVATLAAIAGPIVTILVSK